MTLASTRPEAMLASADFHVWAASGTIMDALQGSGRVSGGLRVRWGSFGGAWEDLRALSGLLGGPSDASMGVSRGHRGNLRDVLGVPWGLLGSSEGLPRTPQQAPEAVWEVFSPPLSTSKIIKKRWLFSGMSTFGEFSGNASRGWMALQGCSAAQSEYPCHSKGFSGGHLEQPRALWDGSGELWKSHGEALGPLPRLRGTLSKPKQLQFRVLLGPLTDTVNSICKQYTGMYVLLAGDVARPWASGLANSRGHGRQHCLVSDSVCLLRER